MHLWVSFFSPIPFLSRFHRYNHTHTHYLWCWTFDQGAYVDFNRINMYVFAKGWALACIHTHTHNTLTLLYCSKSLWLVREKRSNSAKEIKSNKQPNLYTHTHTHTYIYSCGDNYNNVTKPSFAITKHMNIAYYITYI